MLTIKFENKLFFLVVIPERRCIVRALLNKHCRYLYMSHNSENRHKGFVTIKVQKI